MLRLAVLASGTGTNLQAILDACGRKEIPATVLVVVSDKRDAPALERARKAGVAARFVDPAGKSREEHDREIVRILEEARVELVCLAGYMRILSPFFVHAFPRRILNVHPALLPAFPGAHAHRDTLSWGAKITGCTIHFVDEKVDHGPIVLQAAIPVYPEDSEQSLARRIAAQEHKLYPFAIKLFAEGRLDVDGRTVRVRRGTHSPPATTPAIVSPAVEP